MSADSTVDAARQPPAPVAATTEPGPLARARRYAQTRAIVVPDLKVVYVPVPKAGCTSLLWLLADLAGLDVARFERSSVPEVTMPMTVHDLWVWGKGERRLEDLDDDARETALSDPSWLRFTVVREPASRLWSAWQSKLLMREPRFVAMFGEEPWFPSLAVAGDVEATLASFRAFVAALAERWEDGAIRDPHWTLQTDIVETFPLTHVGRLEQLDATMAVLREHVAGGEELGRDLPRENRTPIPYVQSVYDDVSAEVLNKLYARDFAEFDYPPLDVGQGAAPDAKTLAAFAEATKDAGPVIAEVIARHERIGALAGLVDSRSSEVHKLKSKVQQNDDDIDKLSERIARMQKRIGRLESKVAGTTAHLIRVRAARDEAQGKVAEMLASKSWKVTAPLRRWSRRMRRG